ncbi:MAG: amidohydrolase family protein [Gammaproteobacteria bacterium]|nr:amidohydrolase family protein [Gammaproteobacteria bacterium]
MNGWQVDSHQHFWRIERGDYRWLTPELSALYRNFLPSDLLPSLSACAIDKTVLVQAADSDRETDFLLRLAAQHDFVAAVVGWVDMAAADAAERIVGLASNVYFKGIRPMIQDIADPNWMLRPELDHAFRALLAYNLSFDALVLPQHLPNLLVLLKRYPDLRIVIDHAAKPNIASGNTVQWAENIAAIAAQTCCYCKVSGLVNEAEEKADLGNLAPYFNHLYQCFGARRLMWGSDWPVVNLCMKYGSWRALALQLCSSLTASEKQSLLGQTAIDFYQL